MRWNDGLRKLRRWANSVLMVVPLYSSPLASQRTLKLMLLGCVVTPSCVSRRAKPG